MPTDVPENQPPGKAAAATENEEKAPMIIRHATPKVSCTIAGRAMFRGVRFRRKAATLAGLLALALLYLVAEPDGPGRRDAAAA